MKELSINKVNLSENANWEEVYKTLDGAIWNKIDTVNWSKFDYCPEVHFRMVYSNNSFLIHYKVKEQSTRAIATTDNGQVWKDSCVEFFLTPADDGIYYNFEFNCIGTCLLAAGQTRNQRESANSDIFSLIKRNPSLGKHPFEERKGIEGDIEWEIGVVIPFECLFKHPEFKPQGTIRANFYKCGDDLTVPHYVSWNPINTENPDFHRPEFFGTVKFE